MRPSLEDPLLYQDVNLRGTMVILEALRRLPGCKHVFASSSSVYGGNTKVPFHEDDDVSNPVSPYAATTYCTRGLSPPPTNAAHNPTI